MDPPEGALVGRTARSGTIESGDSRVVTIFRSRLRDDAGSDYEDAARRMVELASTMPGFVEIKTFVAADGERVSLVTFASAEAQKAWREHPEHRTVQRRGREEFYAEYLLQVCRVVDERRFTNGSSG